MVLYFKVVVVPPGYQKRELTESAPTGVAVSGLERDRGYIVTFSPRGVPAMEFAQTTGTVSAKQGLPRPNRIASLYDALVTCIVFMCASFTAWNDWRFWSIPVVSSQVACAAILLLVGKEVLHKRTFRTSLDRLAGSLVLLHFVFLAWLSWIVFTRSYYSRSFLLVSFALLLSWQVVDALVLRARFQTPKLVAIPSEMTKRLVATSRLDIRILSEPKVDGSIDGIVVDMHEELSDEWVRFLAESTANGIPVYHAASVYEAATARVSLEYAHAEWLRELFLGSQSYLPIKRALDVAFVLASLPLVIPLCLIIALVIKLTSPGPVLFWQERVGERGRVFKLVKFRSMRVDAERDGAKFAARDDDRVTPVGRILRRYRLDELPQLWNVLKGDMSIVGPRPEQVAFARQFEKEIPFYQWRHRVKPGITGWAQVQQGYAAGVEDTIEKLEYDLYYVKHLSFWLDVFIMLRTVRIILTGFGAR